MKVDITQVCNIFAKKLAMKDRQVHYYDVFPSFIYAEEYCSVNA